jgi:hypothetical protein
VSGTRKVRRQKGKKLFETATGVLMEIGVPGSDERDAERVGENGAELAEFAGGVAERVPGAFEKAKLRRVKELRHEKDFTAAIDANFLDEFGKSAGGCEIDDAVGFAAGAVASGDDGQVEFASTSRHHDFPGASGGRSTREREDWSDAAKVLRERGTTFAYDQSAVAHGVEIERSV